MAKAVKLAAVFGLILVLTAIPLITSCAKPAPTLTPAPTPTPTVIVPTPTPGPTPTAAPTPTPTPGPTPKPETLILGHVNPMTGSGSAWGIAWQGGTEIAVDEINSAGGVKVGGKRYNFKIVTYDDKYTASDAVTAFTKLISQDGAKYILGTTGSAGNLAVQPIVTENKVLQVGDSGMVEVINAKAPYSFRITLAGPFTYATSYPWLAKTYPQAKRVALVNPNDATGMGVPPWATKAANAQGMEVVESLFYERGTADFYPVLTKLLAKNPDVIDFGTANPGETGLMLKQLREMGYKGAKLAAYGSEANVIVPISGPEAAEGFIVTSSMDFTIPEATQQQRDFYNKFVAKYGVDKWLGYSIYGYMGTYVIKDAMEAANSIDPTKVRDQMATMTFNTLLGPMGVGGEQSLGIRRQFLCPYQVAQVRNGKTVFVQWSPLVVP